MSTSPTDRSLLSDASARARFAAGDKPFPYALVTEFYSSPRLDPLQAETARFVQAMPLATTDDRFERIPGYKAQCRPRPAAELCLISSSFSHSFPGSFD